MTLNAARQKGLTLIDVAIMFVVMFAGAIFLMVVAPSGSSPETQAKEIMASAYDVSKHEVIVDVELSNDKKQATTRAKHGSFECLINSSLVDEEHWAISSFACDSDHGATQSAGVMGANQ